MKPWQFLTIHRLAVASACDGRDRESLSALLSELARKRVTVADWVG
jgi:hypothetical protein